ncbi:MAG: PaaI family thioesterase [Thermomicrobiales bacterium]|nr:PaaI family thioesterase [Thermomicrobiales bacterium]
MSTGSTIQEGADTLASVRADHDCFGCGARNRIGLKLRFRPAGDGVSAAFTPAPEHQGYENVIHGGIISTLLDEAMAWAVATRGIWAVTGEMRVRFRHPLHVGEPVTASGSVVEERGRIVSAAGTIARDEDGATIASATGTFVRVDKETEAAWRARYLAARNGE